MKLFFSLIIPLFFLQSNTVDALRNAYSGVNISPAKSSEFISIAKNSGSADAVSAGYKEAADFLSAKYEKVPAKRRALLVSGVKSLENLITKNPKNVELHFIRFSIQENLPPIVGYFRNLREDKAFILKNYASEQPAVKNLIRSYSLHSKTMTAQDKALLK